MSQCVVSQDIYYSNTTCKFGADKNPMKSLKSDTIPQKQCVMLSGHRKNLWAPFCLWKHSNGNQPFGHARIVYITSAGWSPVRHLLGPSPYLDLKVREYQDEWFPIRWIGHDGLISWLPRLPCLTPLDVFFCGCIKNIVRSRYLNHVKEKMREAVDSIALCMLQRRGADWSYIWKSCLKLWSQELLI